MTTLHVHILGCKVTSFLADRAIKMSPLNLTVPKIVNKSLVEVENAGLFFLLKAQQNKKIMITFIYTPLVYFIWQKKIAKQKKSPK